MTTSGAENPEPSDESDLIEGGVAADRPPEPRIPPSDPEAHESGKLFFVGNSTREASLVVTLRSGLVTKDYAPAELIAKVHAQVTALLKTLGNGFEPMFYGADARASMSLFFGDPDPGEAQGQLPVDFTAVEAQRVAKLIPLEGDELFTQAVLMGPAVSRYSELTHIVQTEGIALNWHVRGDSPAELTPEHARVQHKRLSQPPPTIDRPLTVNGVLYRVITESTRDGYLGSVGLHLHNWSSKPPGSTSKRPRIIALYEYKEVEHQIKAGLVGESVEASLVIRLPAPGTTFEPERFDLVLDGIASGPTQDSVLGEQAFDPDEEI